MLKFPEAFEQRPVAFTGLAAGAWGALRPVEQLAAIFSYRNAHLFPARVYLPGINQQLSPDGRINNEDSLKRLKEQASGFLAFIGKLR
jgi:NAD(P)H-dependent FMN reductase